MKKISLILIISLLTFSIGCGDPLPVEPQTQTSGTVSEVQDDVTSTVSSEVSEPEVSVSEPEPEPVHEHNIVCESNGDGTHTNKCISTDGLDCDFEESTEVCELNEEYKCEVCGYEHTHELEITEAEEEQKHIVKCMCEDCDYEETVECTLDEDYVCTECGRDYSYTVEPVEEKTMYATTAINIRSIPDKSGDLVKKVNTNDELIVTGLVKSFKGNDVKFYQLKDGSFADGRYVSETKVEIKVAEPKTESTTQGTTQKASTSTLSKYNIPNIDNTYEVKVINGNKMRDEEVFQAIDDNKGILYLGSGLGLSVSANIGVSFMLDLLNVSTVDEMFQKIDNEWTIPRSFIITNGDLIITVVTDTKISIACSDYRFENFGVELPKEVGDKFVERAGRYWKE